MYKGRILFLFLLISTAGFSQTLSKMPARPIGWTNDFENIFTAVQIQTLDNMISAFEKKTSCEIAVITVPSTMAGVRRFDSLIMATANAWQVGKKDKQNGLVIGFSSGLRQIRISNGNGVRAKLTDAETKTIIDTYFLPAFRQNQFYDGTINGLKAIMQELE